VALIASIKAEYRRYKGLGEDAIAQLTDDDLARAYTNGSNSIAVIVWHISGNLRSRFTDFRTTDGEKSWRNRDEEFENRIVTRAELLEKWNAGWDTLFAALDALSDADLDQQVTIRQQPLAIGDALHRSLAHTSYHVGQIVYIAKWICGPEWSSLTIPKGGSAAYNQHPTRDRVNT
jgi:uncharacterized damage-inducible protein DinB